MMTRRNFEDVAAVLKDMGHFKDEYDSKTLFRVTQRLADVFEQDNPRFDRPRFYKAAGV